MQATNMRLAKWRVTRFIEHYISYQLLLSIISCVFRNLPLRQAPKRFASPKKKAVLKRTDELRIRF